MNAEAESAMKIDGGVSEPEPPGRPSAVSLIFWASFLGLFLELALIRWVSSEVRVFAYCKNLVLVASFLGFGTGCFLSRRRVDLTRAMFILLLLTLVVRLPWQLLHDFGPQRVSTILAEFSGFMIFSTDAAVPWNEVAQLAFAVGWTATIFFVVAVIMVPFGQLVAGSFSRLESPVVAYSINVAGSLAGILSYNLLTVVGAPPLVWFVPVVLGALFLDRGDETKSRQGLIGTALALTLVLLPADGQGIKTFWSTYQKLTLVPGQRQPIHWHILVNNTGYQNLFEQPALPATGPIRIDRFSMPYAVRRPPGRVLIVGAGSGNDAALALLAGATRVTAVEIDRKIYEIGEELHPQAPYSDPRVEVVIDDARNYLKSTDRTFDLVVFSHLDSHTLLSSYTNVRLDNYIYTVEAFREARGRLAPGGVLYLSFLAKEPFVGRRLARNLSEAFGHPPVFLKARNELDSALNVYMLTGEAGVRAELADQAASWSQFVVLEDAAGTIAPTTDSWPFLPLEKRGVPPFIALMAVLIMLLSLVFALKARPRGESFDGRVFWLGAAFLLLEVHNVSRLALVFGTTWKVNAWVIGMILGLILVANATYLGLRRIGRTPGGWAVGGLFLSLAAAYLVPAELFLGSSGTAGKAAATLVYSAPLFFAALVFAEAFAGSVAPGFALGWNILGAVVGGMAENLSYLFGIPALVPLAAAFYVAALVWPRPSRVAAT